MSNHTLETFISFAESLADTSGSIIRQYFRKLDRIQTKIDKTPVTEADIRTEEAMRIAISKQFPDHGIIGEEFDAINPTAEYQWVLDPIDGTLSFIAGRPIFGTLIALTHRGVPLIGIIDQPIVKDRWIGVKHEFASFNGKMAQTSAKQHLSDTILATTSPGLLDREGLLGFHQVSDQAKYTIYGGDCYNYGLLASGSIDIVIETGLKPHDFCALAAVVEAAGGIMTDFNGQPITTTSNGRVVACNNKKIHQQVLALLKV